MEIARKKETGKNKQGLIVNMARACHVGVCLFVLEAPGEIRDEWNVILV